ncbi:dnaA initiator-associating protein [Tasmannia lanceolata]|uniref:dnaA initiator-associating protein n=1 Tax=Tasmannia lanceolata TaxID=3420 RepID=UPI00406410DE
MEETSGKRVSNSAIVEKRPQRPGGCVGIFIQLLEWNRRLAKKKLFSNKMLPPGRAKWISKKFSGEKKLPVAKLCLIEDENRGGFPNTKKPEIDSTCSYPCADKNYGMRTPGLVARLMGLESMPALHHDKPKKVLVSEFYYDQEKELGKRLANHNKTSEFSCSEHDSSFEKGPAKLDSRPQKIQKTGLFERQPVSRFGAEALQLKGVLNRSKKHHQKLVSPIKSPRTLSRRNAARLMVAATKILEPESHPNNRAKCYLTYSPSPHLPLRDKGTFEGMPAFLSEQSREPTYPFAAKSLKEQSSCGSLLDVVSNIEERVPKFTFSSLELSNTSSQGLGKSKMKPPLASQEQERVVSLAVQGKANVQRRTQNFPDRKPYSKKDHGQCVRRRQCKPQLDVASNLLKSNCQKQNQILIVKDKVPPKPKLCSRQIRSNSSADTFNGAKDYISLNRNLNNHTRTRIPTKVLDNKIGRDRSACDKKDDSSSRVKTLVRKRRPMSTSPQIENVGFVSSTIGKERSVRSDVITRNGTGLNAHSMNQRSVKNEVQTKLETLEKTKGRVEILCTDPHPERVISGEKNGNSSYQSGAEVRGDTLGALLERKLRELTRAGGDALEAGDALSGKSTASILQELISALTTERPLKQENGDNCAVTAVGVSLKDNLCHGNPDRSHCNLTNGQIFNTNTKSQVDTKEGVPYQFMLTTDCDHSSPTSILDAPFSNDSVFSGSLDSSPGFMLNHQSPDQSHEKTVARPSNLDPDLSDFATSSNAGIISIEKNTHPINNASRKHGMNPADIGLMGTSFNYVEEVISNSELLFENLTLCGSDSMGDSFLDPIVLEILETLADSLWTSPICSLGFIEDKERHQIRRFLFDCIIESLDSKYSHYCKSGFRAWGKLPLLLSREKLTREVYEEITRWRDLAGKNMDEIIERDMRKSLGKWTCFEIEMFETGIEIQGEILQILVDEMVMDLWLYR